MSRAFISKDEAIEFTGRDGNLIGLEVGAVNTFLDNYLKDGVEAIETSLNIIKLSAIRILNYWNKNDPSLKEVSDIDVTFKYDTSVNKSLIPPDVIQMLKEFKREDTIVKSSYGFSFL